MLPDKNECQSEIKIGRGTGNTTTARGRGARGGASHFDGGPTSRGGGNDSDDGWGGGNGGRGQGRGSITFRGGVNRGRGRVLKLLQDYKQMHRYAKLDTCLLYCLSTI